MVNGSSERAQVRKRHRKGEGASPGRKWLGEKFE